MAAYVVELRQLSEHWVGGMLDDMLLLAEPTLDFKKALEITKARETAANNTKDLRKADNNMN